MASLSASAFASKDSGAPGSRRTAVVLLAALVALLWACPGRSATLNEGFETYNQGFLDKNMPGGENAAPNGSGNPWWGPLVGNYGNFTVTGAENGVTPQGGAQMIRNEVGSMSQSLGFDNDFEYFNLAFRLNQGKPIYTNFVAGWWFYDPCGNAATDPNGLLADNYDDFVMLGSYLVGLPPTADYLSTGTQPEQSLLQNQLLLGAYYLYGFSDTSKYQARVFGATNGIPLYPSYFNTATTRSVGWHHARIVFGSANPITHTGPVNFYIDDMIHPTLTQTNAKAVGFNCLQLNSQQNLGQTGGPIGGYFDDFYLQDGVTAPTIVTGLTNTVVSLGDTVSLIVSTNGTPPPALYWQKDGRALTNNAHVSGVGTTNLTITGVTATNLGSYSLIASNIAGAAVSTALVMLPVPPTIDSQSPPGGIVQASLGTPFTFSVTAHASHPISYRWSKDGSPLTDGGTISGAATAALAIANLVPADAGVYSCHLSDADGVADSDPVTLQLPLVPTILSQSGSLLIGAGTNANFTVTAVGPNLVYQWVVRPAGGGVQNLVDGGRISGATSPSLRISGALAADAGTYTCLITNINGSITTADANLTVVDPPVLTAVPQPALQITDPGSNILFHVAAQGSLPMTYQWYRSGVPLTDDGVHITGATTSDLALQSITTEDEGMYQCAVSNFANIALSSGAVVRVTQPTNSFSDSFEDYDTCCLDGGPGSTGRRGGGALDGMGPWWGINGPNIRVFSEQNGIIPHTGTNMIGGPWNGYITVSDNDHTYLNLSYRFNGGARYFGNIMLDWYFCDLYPANNDSLSDQVSLCNYSLHMPVDSDQDSNKPDGLLQRLAIGSWVGGDKNKYQCAVMTASDGLTGNNGDLGGICKYFNSTTQRAAGWHHARIMVGPAAAETRIATCYFFIDDMLNAVLVHDNAGGVGFNSIDLASDVIYSGGNYRAAAGYFDDLTFQAVNDPFILEQPVSQTVSNAAQATLAVTAFGTSYQWQKDGVNLAGATNMQLTLNSVTTQQAGNYTCVVTGARGSVTSSNAVLTVAAPPTLSASLVGKKVVITWDGSYVLQSAPNATGSFQDISGAASPYTNSFPDVTRYFRLRQ